MWSRSHGDGDYLKLINHERLPEGGNKAKKSMSLNAVDVFELTRFKVFRITFLYTSSWGPVICFGDSVYIKSKHRSLPSFFLSISISGLDIFNFEKSFLSCYKNPDYEYFRNFPVTSTNRPTDDRIDGVLIFGARVHRLEFH